MIGGGHNGLVAACVLAEAGVEVTVLERAERCGGCLLTLTLGGLRADIGAIELGGIARIAHDLRLDRYGLRLLTQPYLALVHTDGDTLAFHHDARRTLQTIEASLGSAAADGWGRLANVAARFRLAWGALSAAPPGDLRASVRALRHLGPHARSIPRLLAATAEQVARRYLTHEPLVRAVTAYGSHGQIPPWAPGSGVFGLLLPSGHGLPPRRAAAGSDRVITALASHLHAHGGSIIRGVGARNILVERDIVRGVCTEDDRAMSADIVISTIDLRRTAAMLPDGDMGREAAGVHSGIFNVGELSIAAALDGVPPLPGPADGVAALRLVVPGPVGEAFEAVAHGRLPDPLPVMWALPSLNDPERPTRDRVALWVSAFVPARGDDDRRTAVEAALGSVERVAPGITSRIVEMRSMGPEEWEARTGNPAGNPNHLDLTLDQLLWCRPTPRLAHYRTPVRGLYLSGAGTHPGGGVTGLPGLLAARTVLADLSRRGRRARRAP